MNVKELKALARECEREYPGIDLIDFDKYLIPFLEKKEVE